MKRIILIMALAASSAFAEHIYPANADPTHTAFFGQLGRDSTVVTNPVSGAARPLPPFLHALSFDDVYPEAAAAWYRQADYSGNCSARRFGNVFERNMDWRFDYMPEFVTFVSAAPGRFASVGVSNVGTNLTEDMVTSGRWSPWLKALPGHTLDGVNENGVVACINVVGGNPQTSGWHTDGDINPLGAVRYALDNGTTAAAIAADLAANIRFPVGFVQNFHYMIADATSTYIVENGEAHAVTNAPAVMTNFRLYGDTVDVNGAGWERYAMLTNADVSITNAWFTNAYRGDGWASEFESNAERMAAITEWAKRPKEAHRGESFGGKSWWQSVHTSTYDITAKTLRICVQETGDWYVFALPQGGKVKSVNGQIGDVIITPDGIGAITTNLVGKTIITGTNTHIKMGAGTNVTGTDDMTIQLGGGMLNVPANLSVSVSGARSLETWGITNSIPKDAADVHALPDTYTPPVTKVNNKTGAVVLSAADVHALPDTYTPPPSPVQSVNGLTGAVVVTPELIGAMKNDATISRVYSSDSSKYQTGDGLLYEREVVVNWDITYERKGTTYHFAPSASRADLWFCNEGFFFPMEIAYLKFEQVGTSGRWQLIDADPDWGDVFYTAYASREAEALSFSGLGTGTRRISGGTFKVANRVAYTNDVLEIVREHSGDYWDEELQVWWTGRMSGGKLTYMATTNVNLNAEH